MKELNIVEFFDNHSSYLESIEIIHSKENLERLEREDACYLQQGCFLR
jgi:hypothetical protein